VVFVNVTLVNPRFSQWSVVIMWSTVPVLLCLLCLILVVFDLVLPVSMLLS